MCNCKRNKVKVNVFDHGYQNEFHYAIYTQREQFWNSLLAHEKQNFGKNHSSKAVSASPDVRRDDTTGTCMHPLSLIRAPDCKITNLRRWRFKTKEALFLGFMRLE